MPVQGEIVNIGDSPSVLIIKPSSLGDIIHSLPFLSSLKKRYPSASVHWAVFKGLEGILEGHPLIDRLIVIDKQRLKNPLTLISTALSLRSELKGNAYDIAVDLQGLFRSGLIAALSSAPVSTGFTDAREGSPLFYTHAIRGGREIHAVDRYLKLAGMLDCDISKVEFPMVHDECPPPFEGDYAVLVPGARWATKRWSEESFGSLASMLPVRSVVVGGREDIPMGETIASLSSGKCVNMAGKTSLRELSGLIRNAQYTVTNDTGPMHIAAAHNVPVYAIFGPTDPLRTGPYGSIHTIIRPDIPCAPCFRRKCDDLRCMAAIEPEKVFKAISSDH
ncbi:glycosyltransferase family 9 protein [Nitrospirota bacterium]